MRSVEEFGAVLARAAEEVLLAARVEGEVGGDVVDAPVERRPNVLGGLCMFCQQ